MGAPCRSRSAERTSLCHGGNTVRRRRDREPRCGRAPRAERLRGWLGYAPMPPDARKDRLLARWVPAAGWLPRYDRACLRGDVTAGVAVTALVVPKNLGYAGI